MAAITAIALGDYLRTVYEHDCEFIDGEVVERSLPNKDHAWIQAVLTAMFFPLRRSRGIVAYPELRIRLGSSRIRIPNVAIYSPEPADQVPSTPPLAVIEILSPDDRYSALLTKLRDYHDFGVKHIWVVDPAEKRLQAFDGADLRTVPQLELSEAGLIIAPNEIFE